MSREDDGHGLCVVRRRCRCVSSTDDLDWLLAVRRHFCPLTILLLQKDCRSPRLASPRHHHAPLRPSSLTLIILASRCLAASVSLHPRSHWIGSP